MTLSDDGLIRVVDNILISLQTRVAISVGGYDTSLPAKQIIDALRDHFKSCGEIIRVRSTRDIVTNELERRAFVVLCKGAEEKALQLNGSEVMEGWKADVKVMSCEGSEYTTDQLAAMSVAHCRRRLSHGISVTGYDASLPAEDVKSALRKHFSTCGHITDVFVLN
ncbi:unnamed protein product, partial [Thlaspi arvense]